VLKLSGRTTHLPIRAPANTYFKIEGRPFEDSNQHVTPQIHQQHDYLNAQGIPLVKAAPSPNRRRKSDKDSVINEAFARTYFRR